MLRRPILHLPKRRLTTATEGDNPDLPRQGQQGLQQTNVVVGTIGPSSQHQEWQLIDVTLRNLSLQFLLKRRIEQRTQRRGWQGA